MSQILVRYSSEVVIKARSAKTRFVSSIRRQIITTARKREIACEVKRGFNCLVVETDQPLEMIPLLKRLFGLAVICPIDGSCEPTLDEIVKTGAALYSDKIQGQSFAVRARRCGVQTVRRSEIEVHLGAALNPFGTVRLKNPEFTVFVEVLNKRVLFYSKKIRAAGGIPACCQGNALALISGGFDSAVAAWRIMRRGVRVHFLFCNLGGSAYERSVLQVTKVLCDLWGGGYHPRFCVVDFEPIAQAIRHKVHGSAQQVVLKRKMFEVASRVAEINGFDVLVTGEAIGQVSSQVLRNLKLIEEKATVPVFRPLIGTDKDEIMAEAKTVGTAVLSEKIREYCALSDEKPMTTGRRDKVEKAESYLPEGLVDQALNTLRKIDVHSVDGKDLRRNYLYVDKIPKDAVIVDCQESHMHRSWHWPDSIHIDWEQLVSRPRDLDKTKTYLLYCTYGTKSPYAAEILQLQGYEAYAFKGDLGQVQQMAQSLQQ